MIRRPTPLRPRPSPALSRRSVFLFLLLLPSLSAESAQALPRRLVLFLDGVPYPDVKDLQQGAVGSDGQIRQCFTNYFPVSRMISTYPSASDVASTDIFGNRPLPGYQRTYYSYAANSMMFVNAVTSAMEFERQMDWLLPRGWPYARSFVAPLWAFKWEVPELIHSFLSATNQAPEDRLKPGHQTADQTFYAYITSTDNAQHLARDIRPMLCELDRQLEQLRATYRAREGRELEVLIFSDHGNNHSPAKRVKVRRFLRQAGYRISTSIRSPKDVVLPTAGIESWVEIHNDPSQTESLLACLTHLEGVDILTACAPFGVPALAGPHSATNFIVMNSQGERALIDWNPAKNSFRYRPQRGDPISYIPVVQKLKRECRLDNDGFGEADAWLRETTSLHYPVALERIVRGHTRVTLNPASIILSLDPHYVHAAFWIKAGSGLVNCGGTHGGLSALDSAGIVLSSFAPTVDTTTCRLAGLYGGFKGVRDYRSRESGGELISAKGQALTEIGRTPLDRNVKSLNPEVLYLRVWSPRLRPCSADTTLDVEVTPARDTRPIPIRRSDPRPSRPHQGLTLAAPISLPDNCPYERIYPFPETAKLGANQTYILSASLGPACTLPLPGQRAGVRASRICQFQFRTDDRGQPVVF